jgi:hypothetical protein
MNNPAEGWGSNTKAATVEPTRKYRIIRSSYTRQEGKGDNRRFVHYRAGGNDIVEMTDRQADRFGRRFLVEISPGGIEKPTEEQRKIIESQAKAQTAADKKAAEAAQALRAE